MAFFGTGPAFVEADPLALKISNNLSDLASAPTARTNLALGTGDSPDFAGLTIGGAAVATQTFVTSQGYLSAESDPVWAAQGFRRDGTVAMTGNADLGTNAINNVGSLELDDGVNASTLTPITGGLKINTDKLDLGDGAGTVTINSVNGATITFHQSDVSAWSMATDGRLVGHDAGNGGFDITHVASAANPSAGRLKLYPQSDDRWYQRTSAGTITAMSIDSNVMLLTGANAMSGNLDVAGNSIVSTAAFTLEANSNTDQLKLNVDGSAQIDGINITGETSGPDGNVWLGTIPNGALTGIRNTVLGDNSGTLITTGRDCTIVGANSGNVASSNEFTGVGYGIGGNGTQTTAIGALALQNATAGSGDFSTTCGYLSLSFSNVSKVAALGYSAGTSNTGSQKILIGSRAGQAHTGSSVIALVPEKLNGITSGFTSESVSNEMIVGDNLTPIRDIYLGEGGRSPSPGPVTIHGTNADGTDVAAGNVTIAAGAGTGTGVGGHLLFQTAAAGGTGSTVNILTTHLEITDDAKIGLFGVTPIARPSAYTQTYATASKTLPAYTPDDESVAYTGAADGEAKLADLNALRVAYETLRAHSENTTKMLNAVIDDLQALGPLQ